ncbi:MAG: hypothetical protein ACYTG6_17625 [Planctomycetota bacterium]|jgi:hypothetical protein
MGGNPATRRVVSSKDVTSIRSGRLRFPFRYCVPLALLATLTSCGGPEAAPAAPNASTDLPAEDTDAVPNASAPDAGGSSSVVAWSGDLEAAMVRAASNGRLVLVYLGPTPAT